MYSGSAFPLPNSIGVSIPWLSASVPTNDMMIFAYPSNSSDPFLIDWKWYESNPVIFSPNESSSIPPGRDPTELWECNSGGETKRCMAYATQASQGCPCSGTSGIVVYSATFQQPDSYESPGVWSSWTNEGYMAVDVEGAVMWECPDVFLLDSVDPIDNGGAPLWMMKYSIGPGPSYEQPWGTVGPRDYYVTGSYNPLGVNADSSIDFQPNDILWEAAMNRSRLVVLDIGAFYASKSYEVPGIGRVLWGWLPEEREVDSHGEPYGWAGAMSLPRVVIPYKDYSPNSPWYVRTVPLQSTLDALRVESSFLSFDDLIIEGASDPADSNFFTLSGVSDNQLELHLFLSVDGMRVGDVCGLRVLSSVSLTSGSTKDVNGKVSDNWLYEFTDIGVQFTDSVGGVVAKGVAAVGAVLFVDPIQSTTDTLSLVNRTRSDAYPINITSSSYYVDETGGGVELHIIVDKSVVEAFFANGTRVATRRVYPSNIEDAINVQVFSQCGEVPCQCKFNSIRSWSMRSANITDSEEIADSFKKSHDNDDGLSDSTVILTIVLPVIFGMAFLVAASWIWIQRRNIVKSNGLLGT